MRIASIIIATATLSACSSYDGGPDQIEETATNEAAVTGCGTFVAYDHTITNVANITAIGDGCPAVWLPGFDPMHWRPGRVSFSQPFLKPTPPTVDTGACTWIEPSPAASTITDCQQRLDFVCPNGNQYQAVIQAVTRNWDYATVTMFASEPGCQRNMRANFNKTNPQPPVF